MADIYDSAFRTVLNDCSKLIIPIINISFGEHYTGDEQIIFFPNEHFIDQQNAPDEKRITDTNFAVYGVVQEGMILFFFQKGKGFHSLSFFLYSLDKSALHSA